VQSCRLYTHLGQRCFSPVWAPFAALSSACRQGHSPVPPGMQTSPWHGRVSAKWSQVPWVQTPRTVSETRICRHAEGLRFSLRSLSALVAPRACYPAAAELAPLLLGGKRETALWRALPAALALARLFCVLPREDKAARCRMPGSSPHPSSCHDGFHCQEKDALLGELA